MSRVCRREFPTRRHVVRVFRDDLGYEYLGHWKDRPDNANVEEALLKGWLRHQGCGDKTATSSSFMRPPTEPATASSTLNFRFSSKSGRGRGQRGVTGPLSVLSNPRLPVFPHTAPCHHKRAPARLVVSARKANLGIAMSKPYRQTTPEAFCANISLQARLAWTAHRSLRRHA